MCIWYHVLSLGTAVNEYHIVMSRVVIRLFMCTLMLTCLSLIHATVHFLFSSERVTRTLLLLWPYTTAILCLWCFSTGIWYAL